MLLLSKLIIDKQIFIIRPSKGKFFVYRCKRYILQYLIIKPTCTFFVMLTTLFDDDFTVKKF